MSPVFFLSSPISSLVQYTLGTNLRVAVLNEGFALLTPYLPVSSHNNEIFLDATTKGGF